MRISDWSPDVCSSDLRKGHCKTESKFECAAVHFAGQEFVDKTSAEQESAHDNEAARSPMPTIPLRLVAIDDRHHQWDQQYDPCRDGRASDAPVLQRTFDADPTEIGRASCREKVCH